MIHTSTTASRASRSEASAGLAPWAQAALALFALCMAAQVRIPLPGTDVPATLQSLVILVIGLATRPAVAAGSTLSYLAAGALGAPVFASTAGLLGPTGGYLAGFVIGAIVMSATRGRGAASMARLLVVGGLGLAIVFACGLGWRVLWMRLEWTAAVLTGVAPFLVKAMIELVLVAGALAKFSRRG